MSGLADNVLKLSRMRLQRDQTIANLETAVTLTAVTVKGSNPGELRMLSYVPAGLPAGAPLVVALHGCTQNAAAYDQGSGWSTLAERHGFALLLPEQQRSNNSNLCFNWFQPEDTSHGRGEAESIRQMILQMIAAHGLDARRVFITGLSAGGAMTATMLATSPELFAGGAIIAGLPHGAANGMMEAFSAMGQGRHHGARQWGDMVRAALPHRGPWPTVQIWQGTADSTVSPTNADELALQWSDVLGLPSQPAFTEQVDGSRHDVWPQIDGRVVLERWTVPGLGHGTPIRPTASDMDQAVGVAGPHMLASGISSTWHIAQSWGLLTQAAQERAVTPKAAPSPAEVGASEAMSLLPKMGEMLQPGLVIERALKAAGLL